MRLLSCKKGFHRALHLFETVDHGEAATLLLGSGKPVIDVVDSHSPCVSTYRHNVDTLARSESNIPVVARHTRDYIMVGKSPA